MSQDSVELIQSVYDAFTRGDVAYILAHTADDARWDFNVKQSQVPWHKPATGPAELPGFFGALAENVEFDRFEPKRFIASGSDVVAYLDVSYTVKRTARRVQEEQLQLWTVRDGKIAGLRHFEDTAQVVAAWGK